MVHILLKLSFYNENLKCYFNSFMLFLNFYCYRPVSFTASNILLWRYNQIAWKTKNISMVLKKIFNIVMHQHRKSKYIKQIVTDLKGEIDSNTIITRIVKTLLPIVNRSSRHKINKKTLDLKYLLDQYT